MRDVQESKRKPLFGLLLLLLIAAVIAGAYYYWEQMLATPLSLLVFVPDCPLYVLLTIPLMLGMVRSVSFSFLVSVGMAKYGAWTVFVLLYHWNAYSVFNSIEITLIFIVGHTGMALLGAALVPKKKIGVGVLLLVLAWFLLNDYADYFLGTRPLIPANGIGLVRDLTIAASFAFVLGFYAYPEKVGNFPPVKFFRRVIGN